MIFQPLRNEPRALSVDPCLTPYAKELAQRVAYSDALSKKLTGDSSLADFASAHEYYGMHCTESGWIFREWAPNATAIFLIGEFSNWQCLEEFSLKRVNEQGDWELKLASNQLAHGMLYKLSVYWDGGAGERIPAYARYVVQDEESKTFSAKIWAPERSYCFKNATPIRPHGTLIYESHVGMAQEEPKMGSFREYRENILPKVAASGYNTLQLMAIMSHPYYGSFGYHVANFFSMYGNFGTPDEFKELVDAAHGLGLRVIIDLVHSHAVKNEVEGLGNFDGTRYAYFHDGAKGEHEQWDSLCFNYNKIEVLHFLLSNCRFWLDEYNIDGFRFDGVTSMLYTHHGMGKSFVDYSDYFGSDVSEEAIAYLTLANRVIHEVRPDAVTVAEDVSGMPGLASVEGIGFDYRLAMGVTDMWFKLFDIPDDSWDMGYLYYELINRRLDERTISYVECHDQSIVGGQSAIFRLAGDAMYHGMSCLTSSLEVDRARAIHKMARLATVATAGDGYLNFMGNEFGHPEWVDFPREGNNWSYWYARRQWSLAEDNLLHYHTLGSFDRGMLKILPKEFYDFAVQKVKLDMGNKIMIFERSGLVFCFNFHSSNSVCDYFVELLPGSYELVLNSDDPSFGGFGLIEGNQQYFTIANEDKLLGIKLYIPSRCVLVLKRR